MSWIAYERAYPNANGHSVVGNIRVKRAVGGGSVAPRDVLVYLPPSYSKIKTTRYPVLYMHDGQNCFDNKTSYAGEWAADETAEKLAKRGLECIIVAIPNAGKARIDEYGPWYEAKINLPGIIGGAGGRANEYIEYLTQVVKPLIDSSFRTLREPEFTGVAGSSMGGIISLYALLEAPDVFGFAGCFSSAFWVGKSGLQKYIKTHIAPNARIYMDCGTLEGGQARESKAYLEDSRKISGMLVSQGCYDLVYLEDEGGIHAEHEWKKRFPAMLEWFLNPRRKPKVEFWK
jgi:isoamylase